MKGDRSGVSAVSFNGAKPHPGTQRPGTFLRDCACQSAARPSDSTPALLHDRKMWQRVREALGFSGQELAVIQHLLAGHKLTAIAADMDLGLGTVKTYCRRIYRKLDVSDHCCLTVIVVSAYFRLGGLTGRSGHGNGGGGDVGRADDIPMADFARVNGAPRIKG